MKWARFSPTDSEGRSNNSVNLRLALLPLLDLDNFRYVGTFRFVRWCLAKSTSIEAKDDLLISGIHKNRNSGM